MGRIKIKKRQSTHFADVMALSERLKSNNRDLIEENSLLHDFNRKLEGKLLELKQTITKLRERAHATEKENIILKAYSPFTPDGHTRAVCRCLACQSSRKESSETLLQKSVKETSEGKEFIITEQWERVYFEEKEQYPEGEKEWIDEIPF